MNFTKKNLRLSKDKSKVKKTLKNFDRENVIKRLLYKDSTLWKSGAGYDELIKNRLGWLSLPVSMQNNCDEINNFVNEVRGEGFSSAILLGMGGSSLCPEVCKETFGIKEGYLKLLVLDSTDPMTIYHFENSVDIDRTLFIISSKSGTTIEVDSLYKYFFDKIEKRKGQESGKQFIAITDPGTKLENLAEEKQFRKTFTNPADIGGRYSALSYFGLVPAALIGVDIKELLTNAEAMMNECSIPIADQNPAAILGAVIGELSKKGKDKLTFFSSEGIRTFGFWTEQLIAESTGKEGKGVVPVEGESLRKNTTYGKDRLFVFMQFDKFNKKSKKKIKSLAERNFPVIIIELKSVYDLGGQFYLWEFATAIMGIVLQLNPFDEPNVKESKDNTSSILKNYESEGKFHDERPIASLGKLSLFLYERLFKKELPKQKSLKKWEMQDYLEFFFEQTKREDYVSIMAYILKNQTSESLLQKIRNYIGSQTRLATTLGYGPRFLHSTGQLHKGGSDKGVFIQIVSDDTKDLNIPGNTFSFSILKQAQAIGDYEALLKRKKRIIKIDIGSNVEQGLEELYSLIKKVV